MANFKKAKEESVDKWFLILSRFREVQALVHSPCGFCKEYNNCLKCKATTVCGETLHCRLMNELYMAERSIIALIGEIKEIDNGT